jgi:hypothetical protein
VNDISVETQTQLQKRYRTAAFIVLVQIIFSLALIPAAWFLAISTENAITQQSLTALWVAILFIALATFVIRRMLFRWERLKDIYLLKGMSGLLSALQTNALILGAMAEIIAIMGFLIAALGGVKWDMFRAGVVALVVFLINFPRRSVWEKVAGSMEKI